MYMKLDNVYIANIYITVSMNIEINNNKIMQSISYNFLRQDIIYIRHSRKNKIEYIDLETKYKYEIKGNSCCIGCLCIDLDSLIPFQKYLSDIQENISDNMFKKNILKLYNKVKIIK